jgi:arylsulfatase A-like enzyme
MGAQKSIVLVTVDCLRADHVGFMGYDRPTTPFLDSLATESFVFPDAIVAGAPTYYSFPAILASRYPLGLGRDVLGLAPGEPSLASVLKQAGYATASFSAANPYISSQFGYEQGFDIFHNFIEGEPAPFSDDTASTDAGGWASRLNRKLQTVRPAMGPLRVLYDELYFRYCQFVTPPATSLDALRRFPAADVIVDQAREWLASIGHAPFFLWLHLMDPHSPYYPKDAALALMGHDPVTPRRARYLNSYWNRSDLGPARLAHRRNEVIALYDAGIRWVDVQMQCLVERLRATGRWEDCIFALTADHGEELLDHGGRYHPPTKLMEELIHVPLLLHVPGSEKKKIGRSPFSLLHLAPTLLDAAQLPVPSEFRGRSGWEDVRRGASSDDVAISECVAGCTNPFHSDKRLGSRVLSIREARFKLTLQFDPLEERLYDLEADPGEQAPLAPTAQKAVRRRLLELAREHLRCSSSQRDQRRSLRARVRDLQLEWKRSFPQRSRSA